jgi:hypothetical protein
VQQNPPVAPSGWFSATLRYILGMLHPLANSDLAIAARLLQEGFPQRPRHFWREGLDRLRQHPGNAMAAQPLGFLLLAGAEPVGVALTPASVRHPAEGNRVRWVNLSSWYIRPAHRWRAGQMLRGLFSDPATVYTDLTPTADVRRLLPLFGLQGMNHGAVVDLLPCHAARAAMGARVRALPVGAEWPDAGLPEGLLDAHRELDCLPFIVSGPQGQHLVVVRRKRLRGLPAARVVFAQSNAALRRHLGAVARHLLGRGVVCLESDWRAEPLSTPGAWVRKRDLWFARGDRFDDRTDLLSSELCLFDH